MCRSLPKWIRCSAIVPATELAGIRNAHPVLVLAVLFLAPRASAPHVRADDRDLGGVVVVALVPVSAADHFPLPSRRSHPAERTLPGVRATGLSRKLVGK